MIETVLLDYLSSIVDVPCFFEVPEQAPETYIIIERTGGNMSNRLYYSTFAFKTYAKSMAEAAALDEVVVNALLASPARDEIAAATLNSHYNYTDTQTKEYRYQAVFDFVHY